jgi:hypothetical protein
VLRPREQFPFKDPSFEIPPYGFSPRSLAALRVLLPLLFSAMNPAPEIY